MDKVNISVSYPPVVAVVGHVDHGKTSLLDAIRKSNIADREHGGITQRIGASKIEVMHEGKKEYITFIDTPGHEAFSQMRVRGASAADIGLLIVAANDGVKPQTRESIAALKQANIPYIVVLTKADLPDISLDKVKQQLSQEEVLVEGYGGDIPVIDVSSRTNYHIKELLELILLVRDMKKDATPTISPDNKLEAIVIEAKLDQKSGPKATIIIKNGTLSLKDNIVAGSAVGKAKALISSIGEQLKTVTIGEGVELLGFETVPQVGSIVYKAQEKLGEVSEITQEVPVVKTEQSMEEAFFAPVVEDKSLAIILAADTQGSLEAIIQAVPPDTRVVAKKTGDISEADVLMAKSTGAIVLGFNTKVRLEVTKLAQTEKVLVRTYSIIYELIDEVKDAAEGKKLQGIEEILGVATILASFPYEKTKVLGIRVEDGRVARGDKIDLVRNDELVGKATIVSVRQGKETTTKVETGREAGIVINPLLDFTIGDVVLCHN